MNLNKFIAKRNNIIFYTSNDIGVKPILSKINEDMNFYKNADIEDTVVGKAAACLYVLAKIKFVYAHTLSEPAKIYLEKNNVSFKYDKLVKEIRNRTNTDMCPLEKSVIHIEDPVAAKIALENTIKETLPDNFQKAEFLLKKGFVDDIVDRRELRKEIYTILKLHEVNKYE